jgi:hypothetical protein
MPNFRLEPELRGHRVSRRKPREFFGTCGISLFVRWVTGPTIDAFGRPRSEAPRCIGDNRLPAAESCSLMGLPLYEGRFKQAVAPSVRVAGGYCEWVLALAAGVQARAVKAMIDRC